MSTTTEPNILPPITCQPWCVEGDGHAGELHRDDQRCESQHATVNLSMELGWRVPGVGEHSKELEVWAEVGDEWPQAVHVYELYTDFDMRLTATEARALAAHLVAAATLAEQVAR